MWRTFGQKITDAYVHKLQEAIEANLPKALKQKFVKIRLRSFRLGRTAPRVTSFRLAPFTAPNTVTFFVDVRLVSSNLQVVLDVFSMGVSFPVKMSNFLFCAPMKVEVKVWMIYICV